DTNGALAVSQLGELDHTDERVICATPELSAAAKTCQREGATASSSTAVVDPTRDSPTASTTPIAKATTCSRSRKLRWPLKIQPTAAPATTANTGAIRRHKAPSPRRHETEAIAPSHAAHTAETPKSGAFTTASNARGSSARVTARSA